MFRALMAHGLRSRYEPFRREFQIGSELGSLKLREEGLTFAREVLYKVRLLRMSGFPGVWAIQYIIDVRGLKRAGGAWPIVQKSA